jgi:hypothetical protein
MWLPGFIDRLIARKFGSFTLYDPRPIQQESPYTFFLPHPDEIATIAPGDLVKTIFRPLPQNRQYAAERMWVEVTAVEAEGFAGTLVNEAFDMPQLPIGTQVFVPRTHVIDIVPGEGREPVSVPTPPSYWERCMVDDCVLRGASHVDYLYREEPDLQVEGDTYPDSGWRLRGTDQAIEADERAGKKPKYVALGAVLNQDDRWIHLIEEPAGCAFLWDDAMGCYERQERRS